MVALESCTIVIGLILSLLNVYVAAPACKGDFLEEKISCEDTLIEDIYRDRGSGVACFTPEADYVPVRVCYAVLRRYVCKPTFLPWIFERNMVQQDLEYPFDDCKEHVDFGDDYQCSAFTTREHTLRYTRTKTMILLRSGDGYLAPDTGDYFEGPLNRTQKVGGRLVEVLSYDESGFCGMTCSTIPLSRIIRGRDTYYISSEEGLFFSFSGKTRKCGDTVLLGSHQGPFISWTQVNRTRRKREALRAEIDYLRHKEALSEDRRHSLALIELCHELSLKRKWVSTTELSLALGTPKVGYTENFKLFTKACEEVPLRCSDCCSFNYKGEKYNYSSSLKAWVDSPVTTPCPEELSIYDGRVLSRNGVHIEHPYPALEHVRYRRVEVTKAGVVDTLETSEQYDSLSNWIAGKLISVIGGFLFVILILFTLVQVVLYCLRESSVALISLPYKLLAQKKRRRNIPSEIPDRINDPFLEGPKLEFGSVQKLN